MKNDAKNMCQGNEKHSWMDVLMRFLFEIFLIWKSRKVSIFFSAKEKTRRPREREGD